MSKYTQGKWKLHDMEDNVVVGEDHLTIADVNATKRSKEENQANARLIAAAPELLEALKLYRESHNYCVGDEPQELCNKCRIAEQAIAKVEEV